MDPDVTFLSNGIVPILRVVFIAVTGYLTLLLLLRVTAQRSLAQLSPVDLIITITLGSAFGRVITAREVALLEVVAAFVTLIALQWLVANLWSRAPRLRDRLNVGPALLYYDGRIIPRTMRRNHLREEDLHLAVRE
jgi:uncharacterized membrane protein YcaP (DUF421 family)